MNVLTLWLNYFFFSGITTTFILPFGYIQHNTILVANFQHGLTNKRGLKTCGIDMLIDSKMLEAARETSKTAIDSHLEMGTNYRVRTEMERMEGKVHKRFKI